MPNTLTFPPEYARFPLSKAAAKALGCQYYFTGKTCAKGHLAPRYTSSGNCLECFETVKKTGRSNLRGDRTASNLAAALEALEAGNTTYVPERACKHGHRLRFVGSNNCVDCQRVAEEKRTSAGYHRWSRIQKEYGLSREDFEALLAAQGGQCAICKRQFESEVEAHVDHCHQRGHVRSLLCGRCNRGLGLFDENEALLGAAIAYLEQYK